MCAPTVQISLVSLVVGPVLRTLIGQKLLMFLRKTQLKSQSFPSPPSLYHTIQLPLMQLSILAAVTMQAKTPPMNHMYQQRYIPFRLILLYCTSIMYIYMYTIVHIIFVIQFLDRNTQIVTTAKSQIY